MQDQYAQERDVAGAIAAICFAVDGVVHGGSACFAEFTELLSTIDRNELELAVLGITTMLIRVVQGRLDFCGDVDEFLEWLRQISEPDRGTAS